MADSKVSALTELAVEPAGTDEFYINDGGVSKRITWATMETGMWASPTLVTPTLSGALAGGGNDLNNLGVIFLTEQADAEADVAGKGQIWVDNLTPNVLRFTDDAGTDHTPVMSDGTIAVDTITATVEAAEHGAGAIGTAVAPATYRWVEQGVIVTQIKFDLTGLRSVATANDVIGLQAGGAAYIGRNVVATNGIIFKTQFACLETPAGGDNDVNVVVNSSAVLAYDSAGGTTYLSNSGDLLAGQTVENLLPAITANDYIYLTAGTGDTLGDYTAGQYVLTLWGHALIS